MVYVLDENRHQLEGKNGAGAAEAKEISDPVSSVLDPSTKATPVQTGGLDVPREDLSHLPKAPGGGLNRKSTAAEVSAFSEHRIKVSSAGAVAGASCAHCGSACMAWQCLNPCCRSVSLGGSGNNC